MWIAVRESYTSIKVKQSKWHKETNALGHTIVRSPWWGQRDIDYNLFSLLFSILTFQFYLIIDFIHPYFYVLLKEL